NPDDVYAPPNSLIRRNKPIVHVPNFSSHLMTIQVGQILRIAHNPQSWLDRMDQYSAKD
ncbi:hypothetical protein PILCRDRAFT_81621, partial [Piloderma croceum F 1598]